MLIRTKPKMNENPPDPGDGRKSKSADIEVQWLMAYLHPNQSTLDSESLSSCCFRLYTAAMRNEHSTTDVDSGSFITPKRFGMDVNSATRPGLGTHRLIITPALF